MGTVVHISCKRRSQQTKFTNKRSQSGFVGWRLIFKFLHCQQTIANNPSLPSHRIQHFFKPSIPPSKFEPQNPSFCSGTHCTWLQSRTLHYDAAKQSMTQSKAEHDSKERKFPRCSVMPRHESSSSKPINNFTPTSQQKETALSWPEMAKADEVDRVVKGWLSWVW